jgi:signal transduction histidine kinase
VRRGGYLRAVDPFLKLARVPSRPQRSDLLIAGGLAIWGLLEAVFVEGPGSMPVRIGLALAFSLPLAARRQLPLAVLLLIAGMTVVFALIADEPEKGTMPFPSLLLGIFSVALYSRRLAGAVAGLAASVAAIAILVTSPFYESAGPTETNIAIGVFFLGGSWALGLLLKRRADQARLALEESGQLARDAVSDERARIARELHDVIAHSVSVIAMQAGAADEQIDKDPARAREHLETVRRTSREAMNEMRRLLGVLREDEASYTPQPGLGRLSDLIETARAAGLEVSVSEQGERPDLSPGLDLTVYRIVQEALTNARKHGGGAPAEVRLRYTEDSVEVEVTNELGSAAANGSGDGGHGLVGMRERARLFGGRLEAGPADGGFRVLARLPVEETPT